MSILATDENNKGIQAFRLPFSGNTGALSTLAAANVSTPILSAGMYRIISAVNVLLSSGAVGSIATASDMEMRANSPEYFYINKDYTINVYDPGAGGSVVTYTRMP